MVDVYRAAKQQGKYHLKREAILFFFGCSDVNSTWLITSELANQRARKAVFTCVVYTNADYCHGYFAVRPRSESTFGQSN